MLKLVWYHITEAAGVGHQHTSPRSALMQKEKKSEVETTTVFSKFFTQRDAYPTMVGAMAGRRQQHKTTKINEGEVHQLG